MHRTIKKRYIDDYIYKLLEDNFIEQVDRIIVRHYKIISHTNYEINQINELSQKVDQYSNIFYGKHNLAENIYLLIPLIFDDYYYSTDQITEIILRGKEQAYISYRNDILNTEFTEEELNGNIEDEYQGLNLKINAYVTHAKDHLYIRLGIHPNEKNEYLIKLFEIYISTYFNELNENHQNKLLNEIELLPMFNDTILYSVAKYKYLENKKNEIINE